MYELLIVNDDGIDSPGLRSLFSVFDKEFRLTAVAPSSQKSWISKASSYHKNLKYEEIAIEGVRAFVLDGSPSDCVVAGIYHLCEKKPDLLISGINVGANIGDSYVLSSGTVGGAIEGAISDITSIAVGVEFSPETTKQIEFHSNSDDLKRFAFASRYTARIARFLLNAKIPLPVKVFNLNFHEKADENTPLEITTPARYNYGSFLQREDSQFLHKGAVKDFSTAEEGTDMAAIRDGKISLSLLNLLSTAPCPDDFKKKLVDFIGKHE